MTFPRSRNHVLALAAAVAGSLLATAGAAHAQPLRVGSTFPIQVNTPTRFPSVAYDADNDAYLVAWGQFDIGARYVSSDGVPLGASVVLNVDGGSTRRSASTSRVACGAGINACLVTWIEEFQLDPVTGVQVSGTSAIWGRLVRYSAGTVQAVTDPFTISVVGPASRPKHTESAPGVAYSTVANEFLVAWGQYPLTGGPDLMARRVTGAGVPTGDEIPIAVTTLWEGHPSLAYNSVQNEYMVAYYYETGTGANGVGTQRVQAGTGALIGGRNTLYSSMFDKYPEITYNSRLNQYFAISWHISSGTSWMLNGVRADANAEPLTPTAQPLAGAGGGDGIGVAYNPVSDSYFCVYQSNSRSTSNEVWGVLVDGSGLPGDQFEVTVSGTRTAIQPRVAAGSRLPRWLNVTSDYFVRVIAQVVDQGPNGVGGSGTGGGGTTPPPGTLACTTVQPATDWVCDPNTGNWLPPGSVGVNPTATSCPTIQPGVGWVCDPATGNWLPPGSTTGGTTGGVNPTACLTVQPGTGWICDPTSGNWLPPGSVPSGTTGGTTTACQTVQPGANWVCDPTTGNWLPPGSTTGGTTGGTTTACPTVQPGAGWICDPATGNWLPPGSTTGGTTGGTTTACRTIQPGPTWVCDPATGNWLPPGSTTGGTTGGTTTACPTVQPGTGWVCDPATGNWLPPGSTTTGGSTLACPTVQPGANWVCDPATGNWLPPGSVTTGGSTLACPTVQPGLTWVCDPATGSWLPPGYTSGTTSACRTVQPGVNWICDPSTGNWLPPPAEATNEGVSLPLTEFVEAARFEPRA